jgi:hypothetical protein
MRCRHASEMETDGFVENTADAILSNHYITAYPSLEVNVAPVLMIQHS